MACKTRYTTDHAVIRKWVKRRGGWPAKFLHIYFPAYVTRGAFPRIDWEEFFRTFEERQLAFLYQDRTSAGERSYFFRLVSRRGQPVGGRAPLAGWHSPAAVSGPLLSTKPPEAATAPPATRGDAA